MAKGQLVRIRNAYSAYSTRTSPPISVLWIFIARHISDKGKQLKSSLKNVYLARFVQKFHVRSEVVCRLLKQPQSLVNRIFDV